MPHFKLVFYQASFHVIVIDAPDAVEAEKIGREYVTKFPGTARTTSRELVRWSADELTLP